MSEKRKRWYLPIEEPPEGWRLADYITASAEGSSNGRLLRVLGPPVAAPPDASPEARAVLEAAVAWRGSVMRLDSHPRNRDALIEAIDAYAATLTPPDPIAEARKALAEMNDLIDGAIRNFADSDKMWAATKLRDNKNRLSAALDRLA